MLQDVGTRNYWHVMQMTHRRQISLRLTLSHIIKHKFQVGKFLTQHNQILCSRVEVLKLNLPIRINIYLWQHCSATTIKANIWKNILFKRYYITFNCYYFNRSTRKEKEQWISYQKLSLGLSKEKENLPGYTLHEEHHRCYIIASIGPSYNRSTKTKKD